MFSVEMFNYFKNLEKKIDELTKGVSAIPEGYTKKQWNSLNECEKLKIIAPNGIWQREEDLEEEE